MNNMKIIKKGLKPLLAVVALVGMTTAAYAQADSVDNAGGASRSCQSTWTSYSPLKEESSINDVSKSDVIKTTVCEEC